MSALPMFEPSMSSMSSLQPVAEGDPLIPAEWTVPLIIGGVVIVGAWIYFTATQCWFKQTGRMPGWCLAFGAGYR